MNPIPLSHRRRVYAWACGRCGRVGRYGEFVGYDPDTNKLREAIATIARGSREDADTCCRCMECGVELPVGKHSGHCAACDEALEARVRALCEAATALVNLEYADAKKTLMARIEREAEPNVRECILDMLAAADPSTGEGRVDG